MDDAGYSVLLQILVLYLFYFLLYLHYFFGLVGQLGMSLALDSTVTERV